MIQFLTHLKENQQALELPTVNGRVDTEQGSLTFDLPTSKRWGRQGSRCASLSWAQKTVALGTQPGEQNF